MLAFVFMIGGWGGGMREKERSEEVEGGREGGKRDRRKEGRKKEKYP